MNTQKRTILIVLPYGFNERMMNFVEFVVARMLVKNGWHVIGLAREERDRPPQEIVYGIEVHRYRTTIGGVARTTQLFLTHRFDAVHVHTLRNNRVGIIASMLARITHTPLAFSEAGLLHDHYLVDDRDDPVGKAVHTNAVVHTLHAVLQHIAHPRHLLDAARNYLFHWSLTHANALAFYSKHNVPIAQQLGLTNVRYVPQILDESRWGDAEKADIDPLPKPGPYVLFVGQMKLRKGWDVLLRALPHIPESLVRSCIVVTASSPAEPSFFTALATQIGVQNRIMFMGQPSNARLRHAFAQSTVVVVPSRYEGFGLVPLEAFEMEKPVVASRVPAMTDFLVDGENALLVPPKDPEALAEAITRAATETDLRTRLIAGGKKTLALLRSKEYAQQWLGFYDELARER